MDRIFVENISFIGHHGVTRQERAEGRQMLIDVVACFDTRGAARSDALGATVDHAELARIAFELGTANRFKLLETMAARIADAILASTTASAVEVRVRKLSPTLPGLPAATGVTIARNRAGDPLDPRFLVP